MSAGAVNPKRKVSVQMMAVGGLLAAVAAPLGLALALGLDATIIDFSPGELLKWLALALALGLLAAAALVLKSPTHAYLLLLSPLLSLNFVLISFGIQEELFLARNQVGYRPWILIYDPLILVGLALTIPKLLTHKRTPRPASLLAYFFLLYLLTTTLSIFNAYDRQYAFIGVFVYLKLLVWAAVFYYLLAHTPSRFTYLVRGMILFVLFQAAIGVLQVFRVQTVELLFGWTEDRFLYRNDVVRVGGTLGRATLESVLVLMIPLIFAYVMGGVRGLWERRIGLAAALSGIALVFLTGSRGPIIAVLMGTAVAMGLFRNLRLSRTLILRLSALTLILILGSAILFASGEIQNTLLRNTLTGRLESFAVAWRMFLARPLLGVGLNNYLIAGPAFGMSASYIRFGRPVHNLFLLVLSETGLIGLGTFLLFLGTWWVITGYADKRFRHQPELLWLVRGIRGCLLAFLLNSLLDVPLTKAPIIMPFALLLAATAALFTLPQQAK